MSNEKTEALMVRLPADMAAAIKALAKEEDRTVSAEIRRAVRLYLLAEQGRRELAAEWGER